MRQDSITTHIGTHLPTAAALLRHGKLVAIPTETVYGLAANALHPLAVAQIFEVKNRPTFNPLIVHGYDRSQLEPYIKRWPDGAVDLAEAFWPGPLTLLLPRKLLIPDLVTAGLPRVGVRVPNHPLTLALLALLDFPLAAPSANPANYISPTTTAHVQAQLDGKIPYILEGGPTQVGLESTIIGWENEKPMLYRLGGLSVEAIEAIIGPLTWANQPTQTPVGSGMLSRHYAPRTRMIFAPPDQWPDQPTGKVATLSLQGTPEFPIEHQFALSPTGEVVQAAQQLFATLRQLDQGDFDLILAAPVPDTGLGKAINDRLRRASTPATDDGA